VTAVTQLGLNEQLPASSRALAGDARDHAVLVQWLYLGTCIGVHSCKHSEPTEPQKQQQVQEQRQASSPVRYRGEYLATPFTL
jgi:hypothetical protein